MKIKLTLWAALIGVALSTGCATKNIWERPEGKTDEEARQDMRECEDRVSKQDVPTGNYRADKARRDFLIGQCLKEKGYKP